MNHSGAINPLAQKQNKSQILFPKTIHGTYHTLWSKIAKKEYITIITHFGSHNYKNQGVAWKKLSLTFQWEEDEVQTQTACR